MSNIFERLGISQDRAGFNAFNELDNPEDKFKPILEKYLGRDVKIENIGRDLDIGVSGGWNDNDFEEFINQFGLSRSGLFTSEDGVFHRVDISSSKFNEIVSNLQTETHETVESSKSNKNMETENNNMIENIIQTARENKVLIASAGAVAILVMN